MQAIVVTTAKRGVFFGYGEPGIPADKQKRIEKARMCVYWDRETKGILGLAATGPTKGCRITAAVPAITVEDVTSVMECSEQATAAWENGPWTK